MAPELAIDGELQFDATVSPVVAETKCKRDQKVTGQANTFIFPFNRSRKHRLQDCSELGGLDAYGPILRGCPYQHYHVVAMQEIYNVNHPQQH